MRSPELTRAKSVLRGWFSDRDSAYHARVIDECRAGTFAYMDRCHCLLGLRDGGYAADQTPYEMDAEDALLDLITTDEAQRLQLTKRCERLRRVRVLPMVLAEIKRRARVETAEEAIEVER